MKGPIVLRARVVLPSGNEPFLRRLQLEGDFSIADARFSRESTQSKVNELSERAEGGKSEDEEPELALSDVRAHVRAARGTAYLNNIAFHVPGATARGAGTFDLITHKVDIHGKLAMEASLSQASGGGIKSVLLKPLNIFFRGKRAGAVVPVYLTGTSAHPSVGVSLFGK